MTHNIISGGSCGGSQIDFIKGDPGQNGKSAYQLAIESGEFSGDLHCWLKSLQGRDGKDAYRLACEHGFKGSIYDWFNSLVGDNGKSAYELALSCGFKGTLKDWLCSLSGKDAYELAVECGFCGSRMDWLCGLKGDSTYEIACKYGYKGSEEEWINELQDKGISSIEQTCVSEVESNDFVKFSPQVLSEKEQEQARINLGISNVFGSVEAQDLDDMISSDDDKVVLNAVRYTKQEKTNEEIKQAQENLHVADLNKVLELEARIIALEKIINNK